MMEYYTDMKMNEAALYTFTVCTSGSQSVVPGPAESASTSPGNLLEMYIFRPHPRPTGSETGVWQAGLVILIHAPF